MTNNEIGIVFGRNEECEEECDKMQEFCVRLKICGYIRMGTGLCDSAHSWRLHSDVPLGNQATVTMARFPTQSHYPDNELTSPCHILV